MTWDQSGGTKVSGTKTAGPKWYGPILAAFNAAAIAYIAIDRANAAVMASTRRTVVVDSFSSDFEDHENISMEIVVTAPNENASTSPMAQMAQPVPWRKHSEEEWPCLAVYTADSSGILQVLRDSPVRIASMRRVGLNSSGSGATVGSMTLIQQYRIAVWKLVRRVKHSVNKKATLPTIQPLIRRGEKRGECILCLPALIPPLSLSMPTNELE